mgnify:CR=1 FL=1
MYYCVAYRNPEGVLTSTVLTSDDVEEIIEVLGGEILLSSEKHHEASLYSEGFVDGLKISTEIDVRARPL